MVVSYLVHARERIMKRFTWAFAPEVLIICLGIAAFAVDRLHGSLGPTEMTVINVPPREHVTASPQMVIGDEIVDGENGDAVDRWIRAEVLYREALRLGLGDNDLIVRRRLVQKMEYALDNMAVLTSPQRSELEDFYARNAAHYREPATESFTHITFSLRNGIDASLQRASDALSELRGRGSEAGSAYGDPSPDGSRVASASDARLAHLFGSEFLSGLKQAAIGEWDGPLRSRTGIHLVFRSEPEPPRIPELDEVYKRVARDWIEFSRAVAREVHYSDIAARYRIVHSAQEVAITDASSQEARRSDSVATGREAIVVQGP